MNILVSIIFFIPFAVLLWFVIFKFLLKSNDKRILTNIPQKIEKQDKKFFNDGKEDNLKEKLGLGEVNEEVQGQGEEEEEVPEEIKEEEIKEDVNPAN